MANARRSAGKADETCPHAVPATANKTRKRNLNMTLFYQKTAFNGHRQNDHPALPTRDCRGVSPRRFQGSVPTPFPSFGLQGSVPTQFPRSEFRVPSFRIRVGTLPVMSWGHSPHTRTSRWSRFWRFPTKCFAPRRPMPGSIHIVGTRPAARRDQ